MRSCNQESKDEEGVQMTKLERLQKQKHCKYDDKKCSCKEHKRDKLHCCTCDPKKCEI